MLVPKSFSLKNCSVQKYGGGTKLWSNKIRAAKKLVPKKFVENFTSNSWDIPDMDKCHHEKYCLSNVILLIWTKISPGHMLSGQMPSWQLESAQDRPRNLLLKFDQNQVNNSGDFLDMDKYRQNKCCLDKCHHDSWNLFKMVKGTYF